MSEQLTAPQSTGRRATVASEVERRYRALADIAATAANRTRLHPAFADLPDDPDTRLFRDAALEFPRKAVLDRRVLILQMTPDLPSEAVARRLAHDLRDRHEPNMPLFEYQPNDGDELVSAIGRLNAPAIVVIPRASRLNFGWETDRLLDVAAQGRHLIIAATDLARETWGLLKIEEPLWLSLSADGLYDPRQIETLLHQAVELRRLDLPPVLRATQSGEAALGGLPMSEIARALRTPLHVDLFIESLTRRDFLGSSGMSELLNETTQLAPEALFREWFRQRLNRRNQLLSLGIALLDRLDEEMVFEALEDLVGAVWVQGDADGVLIDRADLLRLAPLVTEVELPARRRVELRSPGLRPALFSFARDTLRRHVRLALIWLIGRAEPEDPEAERDVALRRACVESLSDAVLTAPDLADDLLLDLAIRAEDTARHFVARVLARWHERGHTDRLVNLLRTWVNGDAVALALALSQGREKRVSDPADALHAATVLTIARAGLIDRPGRLHPAFSELLETITAKPGPITRNYLRTHGLPVLIERHARPLEVVLRQLTTQEDLRTVIAEQLARSYANGSREVGALFSRWLAYAEQESQPYVEGAPAEPIDAALATLASAVGQIPPDQTNGLTTGELTRGLMQRVIDLKRHPVVRTAARAAMIRQGRHYRPLLDALLSGVSSNEIKDAVQALREIYLEERAALTGGDGILTVGERNYPIFLSRERPKTSVELAVERWMADEREGPAREIALQASAAFVEALDLEESKAIREGRYAKIEASAPLKAATPATPAASTAPASTAPAKAAPAAAPAAPAAQAKPKASGKTAPRERRGFFYQNFVPVFVTLDAPDQRGLVADLMPSARELSDRSPEAFDFLVRRKWPGYNSALIEAVAPRLRRALELEERGWGGLTVGDAPRAALAFYRATAEVNRILALVLLAVIVLAIVMIGVALLG